jgi:hypothetical protein
MEAPRECVGKGPAVDRRDHAATGRPEGVELGTEVTDLAVRDIEGETSYAGGWDAARAVDRLS